MGNQIPLDPLKSGCSIIGFGIAIIQMVFVIWIPNVQCFVTSSKGMYLMSRKGKRGKSSPSRLSSLCGLK